MMADDEERIIELQVLRDMLASTVLLLLDKIAERNKLILAARGLIESEVSGYERAFDGEFCRDHREWRALADAIEPYDKIEDSELSI